MSDEPSDPELSAEQLFQRRLITVLLVLPIIFVVVLTVVSDNISELPEAVRATEWRNFWVTFTIVFITMALYAIVARIGSIERRPTSGGTSVAIIGPGLVLAGFLRREAEHLMVPVIGGCLGFFAGLLVVSLFFIVATRPRSIVDPFQSR